MPAGSTNEFLLYAFNAQIGEVLNDLYLGGFEESKMPVRSHTSASDTFRNEITLQITESGEYQLLLTNPSWDYSIYGTFFYSPQGIDQTPSEEDMGEARKIHHNGCLLIRLGNKTYTITGQEVK